MPVTILECAIARGAKESETGGFTLGELEDHGFSMFGGCARCHASLAAYNGYPSKLGVWLCAECIGDQGWTTAAEALAAMDADDLERDAEELPGDGLGPWIEPEDRFYFVE